MTTSFKGIQKLSPDVRSYVLSFLPLKDVNNCCQVGKKMQKCCQPVFKEQLDLGKKTFEKFLPIEKSFPDGNLKNPKENFIKFLKFVKEEEPKFGEILKKNNFDFKKTEKEIYDENFSNCCCAQVLKIQEFFAKGDKESFFKNLIPNNADSIRIEFATILYEELSKVPSSEINNVNTRRLIYEKMVSFINSKITSLKEKEKNEPLSQDENVFLDLIEKEKNIEAGSTTHVFDETLLKLPNCFAHRNNLTIFPEEEVFLNNAVIPIKYLSFLSSKDTNNHIHTIPNNLDLKQVLCFDVSYNPIKNFPERISLPNLISIFCNYTHLKEIPSCLEKSQKLRLMCFSCCKIDRFPGKWILNLPNLKKLVLYGNNIPDVSSNDIYKTLKDKGVEIYLSENSLGINKSTSQIRATGYLQNVQDHPVLHIGVTLATTAFCKVFFSSGYPISIAAAASSSLLVWKGCEIKGAVNTLRKYFS
jgi:hypothetical protein